MAFNVTREINNATIDGTLEISKNESRSTWVHTITRSRYLFASQSFRGVRNTSLLARSLHGSTESAARRTVRVVLRRDPRGCSPTAAQVLRATPDVAFYLVVPVSLHTHTRISLLRSAHSSLSPQRVLSLFVPPSRMHARSPAISSTRFVLPPRGSSQLA